MGAGHSALAQQRSQSRPGTYEDGVAGDHVDGEARRTAACTRYLLGEGAYRGPAGRAL